MLGLKVNAPLNRVVKFFAAVFQKLDCLGICHMTELIVKNVVQPVDKSLVNKVIEERHFLRRIVKHVANYKFQHILRKAHIVIQVGKRNLRLNHPELCRVARCVRVFGSEGRTEGINIAKRHSERLALQLSAYRERGFSAEEVL